LIAQRVYHVGATTRGEWPGTGARGDDDPVRAEPLSRLKEDRSCIRIEPLRGRAELKFNIETRIVIPVVEL
jgi:hypothetical protein